MKNFFIGSFSVPYFPAFGLDNERYGVSLRIQIEYWKIRTRKTPNTDTFQPVELISGIDYIIAKVGGEPLACQQLKRLGRGCKIWIWFVEGVSLKLLSCVATCGSVYLPFNFHLYCHNIESLTGKTMTNACVNLD